MAIASAITLFVPFFRIFRILTYTRQQLHLSFVFCSKKHWAPTLNKNVRYLVASSFQVVDLLRYILRADSTTHEAVAIEEMVSGIAIPAL